MTALGWVVLAILAAVVGAEAIAWCGPAQQWMLRRAANALPEEHRDRYLEEWTAELKQVPNGPVTRSLWAGGLLLSRNSIARALGAPVSASRGSLLAKRFFDAGVAAFCLVLYGPLLLVIALAIRLDSRGPALFRGARIGRNGRPFVMFNFRTMAPSERGQPSGGEPQLRPTRVGCVLHRYSLDELPQLINVARGDMTLRVIARSGPSRRR